MSHRRRTGQPLKIESALHPLLVLVGPTASGKTAVACEIAKHLPVEMISCDSMQVYKRMPILTQAPPKRFSAGAHGRAPLQVHLVSFLDPSEDYNAALFRKDALKAIEKIRKKGRIPMLVGGTGLYLSSLMDGLFEAEGDEGRDEKLREKLLKEQEKQGGSYLHDKLKKIDPTAAAKIHPNDLRRIVRALEVFHVTGQTISAQKPKRQGIRGQFEFRVFLLERDRAELYARIEKRVDQMVKKGLLAEVKKLIKIQPGMTASMALGYRQMKAVLEKKMTIEEAAVLLKRDTRHYAKRQLSWFRHEKDVEPVSIGPGETPAKTAQKILRLWKKK